MSIVAKKIMMGSGAVGDPVDDQFNRVSFLSHFDGSNNGVNNAFDDGSSSNHTITANGNVTQGSFGPFARPDGEWGVNFDGSNDRLRTNASNLDITTEAFTAEAWIFPVSSMDQYDIIVCMFAASHGSNANQTWSIRAGSGNEIEIVTISSGTQTVQSAGTANIGAWNHVAISRNGTTMYAALNGAVTSKSCASSLNGHEYFYIGAADANGSGAYFFNGVISNVRYEIGNARYTSNYTVPTSKLTATTNTKILTCQSNRFVDNSTSNNTFLISSTPAVTSFGPFLTSSVYDPAVNGASAYSPADADKLTAASSADFAFGTGDFCVEAWVYPTTVSSDLQIVFSSNITGTGNYIFLHFNNSKISIGSSTVFALEASTSTITANAWSHLCWCRDSGTNIGFVNGVKIGTSTTTISWIQNGATVAAYPGSGLGVDGYVSDVRVVKGSNPRGTSSFTPPTAPLTAITNTKLLLNMADGQAIDSAAQNNLTLVGTAKTSTAQKLFGTASLLLDGDSDLVTLPADVGRLSSGNAPIDFTIELAFRLAANVGGTPNSIIARWETSGAQRSWMVRMDNVSSENKIKFFDSSTGSNNASTTFSTAFSSETWYQIALVSTSGAVKLYVNGTADSTTHTWTTGVFNAPYDSTALLSIGANVPSNPDNFFNGNIDEVRLSKFARYTSNFTAPTAAFADKGQ